MSEKEKESIVEEQQQDISELLQIRRDKLAALQAEGNNPFFVNTCDKDISAQEIHDRFEELEGKDVCIAGRIMSWRDSKLYGYPRPFRTNAGIFENR